MKKFLWIFVFLISVILSESQALARLNDANLFTGLIILWQQNQETTDSLWIRTREYKNGEWTEWYRIEEDEDRDEGRGFRVEGLGYSEKETLFSTNLSTEYEYKVESGDESNPGIYGVNIEPILSNRPGEPILFVGLNIPKKPRIISRSEWGADEDLMFEKRDTSMDVGRDVINHIPTADIDELTPFREEDPEIEHIVTLDPSGKTYMWPLQYAKKIRFIVIHHTASVSNLDNPLTALQNIYYYHAVRRGWGDIGYNYVIDTQGNIYEGRRGGEDVIGGHARPVNKTSIGIAVLGNYEENELPSSVLANLMALIEAKAKVHNIDIDGGTIYQRKLYKNIHGHGENSATLCPGKFLKQKFDGVKKLIAYHKNKESNAERKKYGLSDFEPRNIIVTEPDEKQEFIVRLKNTGVTMWNSNTFLERTGKKSDDDIPKIIARLESEKVEPGNIGVFKGTFPKTLKSGLRVIDSRLVINGSIQPQKTIPLPIMVEGLKSTYEIAGRSEEPTLLKAGEKAKAWILLRNTGNFTWKRSGKNAVRIGTTRPDDRKSPFFSNRTRIGRLVEKEVAPGEIGKFVFRLRAPSNGGTYIEHFRPVVEGVTWMKDTGIHFTVNVESAEKPLRVALSFKKNKAEVRSAHGMKLYGYDGGAVVEKEFGKNEVARVSLLKNGKFRVRKGDEKISLETPPRFQALQGGILELVNFENRPIWNSSFNDNLYRGILEVNKVDRKLTVINELPLEDYLKGIAEISNGDPKEKIKTIIILARSYAKYYRNIGNKFLGKPFHLDDNPDHTQKYLGYGLELRSPNIVKAVEETVGMIVTYEGKPVITPYFNQSDGRTRSAEEVWGWEDKPYLQSVPDPFCSTKELKGHGVGLSGCGATELAKEGKEAEEIIKYYYQGVEVEKRY